MPIGPMKKSKRAGKLATCVIKFVQGGRVVTAVSHKDLMMK